MHPSLLLSRKQRRDFRAANERRMTAVASADTSWSDWQLAAIRHAWMDAVVDIPYYTRLVASGRAPRDICSWEDFQTVPILTRQIIQDNPDDFVRRSGLPDGFAITAGSTGTPLRLGVNSHEHDRMRVVKLAAWQEFGYTPSSHLFLLWGHAHLLGTGSRGRFNHLKRKFADAFLGYCRLDAYRLNRASCLEYAEKLLRVRPLGIVGYASALDLFARYTLQFRDRFRALSVRFVLATAEPPPRPDTFPLLEDLFGCPVIEEYGGAEFGQVAFKSSGGAFEVYSDLNYVECGASGADHAHPLVLTSLYGRYVPLIRYGIGDALLNPEVLPHGHVLRFDAVAGRMNDVIRLEDGDSIHSVAIFHCIHQEPAVHNIQMALRDDGIDIRLVSPDGDRTFLETRLRRRLAQVHPLLGRARFLYVEDLQTNRAGKRRWFVDNRTKHQPITSDLQ
jgi:phenylacetate-coenzyme A ligase PaaK-like adenylate-forming protein